MLPFVDGLRRGKAHQGLELLYGDAALPAQLCDVLTGLLHIDNRKVHCVRSFPAADRFDGHVDALKLYRGFMMSITSTESRMTSMMSTRDLYAMGASSSVDALTLVV